MTTKMFSLKFHHANLCIFFLKKLTRMPFTKSHYLFFYSRSEIDDDNYFVEGLDKGLLTDIAILNIQETNKEIQSFVEFFREIVDEHYKAHNITSIQKLSEIMVAILPFLSQYVLLVEYHFHQLLFCHRSSCKLHSVLLGIFSELLQKGFCLPPDEDDAGGNGVTSFEDAENCGIGEGEGMKDVSDQIENEEQVISNVMNNL